MSFLSKPATMPVACNAPLGTRWFGVGVEGPGDICGNMEAFVWEPPLVKLNAIDSATETACLILSVDETVRNQINKARHEVQGQKHHLVQQLVLSGARPGSG